MALNSAGVQGRSNGKSNQPSGPSQEQNTAKAPKDSAILLSARTLALEHASDYGARRHEDDGRDLGPNGAIAGTCNERAQSCSREDGGDDAGMEKRSTAGDQGSNKSPKRSECHSVDDRQDDEKGVLLGVRIATGKLKQKERGNCKDGVTDDHAHDAPDYIHGTADPFVIEQKLSPCDQMLENFAK
jgi:hypothetical protein